ncbi:integrase, catalytic region, zinc finger, CCHC-type containing protein [Tanacetum coccineum]
MRICVNLDHVDELVHNGDVRITVAEHIINLGKVNGAVRDGHQPKTVEKQLYEMGKSKNDDCVICLDEFIEKQHIEVVNSSEGSTIPRLQTIEDLEGVDLLLHDAEMEVMNMILLSIPNEIYNSVDCLPTWPRIFDYDVEYSRMMSTTYSEIFYGLCNVVLAKAFLKISLIDKYCLRASSNTRNQAIIQGDRVNIQSINSGTTGRNNRRAYVQEEVVEGMNAPNETGNVQRTLRTPSSGNTSTVQCYNCQWGKGHYARNCPKPRVRDSKMKQIEELSANICLMARIQPTDHTSDDGPSSNERAKRYNKQAQSQLVRDRDIIRDLEKQRDKLDLDVKNYKRKNEELQKTHSILKRQMSEKEDTYHDTILDLEAKLKKNVDLILKLGNSLQGMFMLGPKPLSIYDQQLKHVLGYPNPYTLKQAISKCPKLYVASSLGNLEIPLNVRDYEDNLKDAFKMNATSRVRRPMSKDSSVTNNVLVNSKKAAKNVSVYRKNKQKDNTSANVISNKENVIDVDVANASKVKTLLYVSYLLTKSRTPKSLETTYVAPKTRFSKKETQSKTLDTTSVVSKSKIDVESASKAKDKVVQIVLWVVDSGCSKHMTGDRSLLRNFIEKFMGTVRFGNDNFAAITGYGDYIHGNITICHVYYVEGLGHNLFSVGKFYDGDLEVAFRSNTCYVRNLQGDDLLTGGRDSNLYTISISDMAASSPVCLMSKATSTKSWLWHRRLSHLNFGTINDLTRLDLVDGLPKFKYGKDHLCSTCIMQQFLIARTPQQNGVVERRNRTLVEAARIMLIFSKLPEFLWAKAVATACFTQNRSICIHDTTKLPYEAINAFVPYNPLSHEEIESSTTALETSNVQNFHQEQGLILKEVIRSVVVLMLLGMFIVMLSYEYPLSFKWIVKRLFSMSFEREVYVSQPEGVFDQNFQIMLHVETRSIQFKHSHIIAMYDKLSSFLIEHGFTKDECVSMSTPMATERLDADLQGTPTDQMTYRRMIGRLMYLTASRPYIAFATFVCARYQARPMVKHLKEVKRIFRYLRQSYNMGLWYLKDSGFELIAYSDADHAGCKDDCKSTSGGLQFLGGKLMSWSSKKQDCTAMSTAEAEYVSLSACCVHKLFGCELNCLTMDTSTIGFRCTVTPRVPLLSRAIRSSTLRLSILTSALPKERFEYLVHPIGMRCMTPTQLESLPKLSS